MKTIRFYTASGIYKGYIKQTTFRAQYRELLSWVGSGDVLKVGNETITLPMDVQHIYK